jgi:Domain of unknown function (DUF222)
VFVYNWDMLERTVEELAALDVSVLCDSEIREIFLDLRRDIDRREAVAARLLAVLHGRGIPAGDGASSTPAWVQSQTGQRFSEARASLDAGQACASLPLVAKAWAQGEISAGAARTICCGQRAGHEDVYASIEETLVAYGANRDVRGLDLMIRHYQARADALDDIEPSDRNHLHISHTGNPWILDADVDELAGVTIATAIDAATDKPSEGTIARPPNDAPTRSRESAGTSSTVVRVRARMASGRTLRSSSSSRRSWPATSKPVAISR